MTPIAPDHELHRRRLGRNAGVAVCLVLFAAVVFGLSLVKILEAGQAEGFDHAPRPGLAAGAEGAGR